MLTLEAGVECPPPEEEEEEEEDTSRLASSLICSNWLLLLETREFCLEGEMTLDREGRYRLNDGCGGLDNPVRKL